MSAEITGHVLLVYCNNVKQPAGTRDMPLFHFVVFWQKLKVPSVWLSYSIKPVKMLWEDVTRVRECVGRWA